MNGLPTFSGQPKSQNGNLAIKSHFCSAPITILDCKLKICSANGYSTHVRFALKETFRQLLPIDNLAEILQKSTIGHVQRYARGKWLLYFCQLTFSPELLTNCINIRIQQTIENGYSVKQAAICKLVQTLGGLAQWQQVGKQAGSIINTNILQSLNIPDHR